MTTATALTVSKDWLLLAATKLEMEAEQSLPSWILLGQVNRYPENMGMARAMREAARIKSIAARREFLRGIGIAA